ncbi:MAG: DUF4198 domain-containing protein [Planctomycetota bacterium]|nr:DUF4198 domain-containing protein [Planctomycetota bacterium]
MRNRLLAGGGALVLALALSGIGHAHGIWVAKRFDVLTVVLGEGRDDQAYDTAKVKKVTGYSSEYAPVQVGIEARQGYVVVNPSKEAALLVVEFDHGYWSKGADGKYVNKPMPEVPGAKTANKTLKYNVVYLDPAVQPKVMAELPLQIVPAVNPAGLKQGDLLEVRVLYQGKPLADAEVIVDVAGDLGNTIKTDANGKAAVPVRNMSLNVIGVEQAFPLEGSDLATATGYFTSVSFVAAK